MEKNEGLKVGVFHQSFDAGPQERIDYCSSRNISTVRHCAYYMHVNAVFLSLGDMWVIVDLFLVRLDRDAML